MFHEAFGLSRAELELNRPKSVKDRTMPPELKFHSTGRSDHARRHRDQLLHHGLDASALGGVTHRRTFSHKTALPHEAKQTGGKAPKGQHQSIGGTFSRGQPFQVQIGRDLAVERLAQPSLIVDGDDVKIVRGQATSTGLPGRSRAGSACALWHRKAFPSRAPPAEIGKPDLDGCAPRTC